MQSQEAPKPKRVDSLTAKHDLTENPAPLPPAPLSELMLKDTELFDRRDTAYADPIYLNQSYCLHSFIPAKGATPDQTGIFGFMKCRGSCQNIEEAEQRSEWLIRNIDSYHAIQTSYAGRPFPVCVDTKKYVQESKEVDIKKQVTKAVSEDIRQKRDQEKNTVKEIHEREKKLLEETSPEYKMDPIEAYTTLRVKKANLVWTLVQNSEKLKEIKQSIIKAREEIDEMDKENGEYQKEFYEKYLAARRQVGLPDRENSEENFIKYMVEDISLDDY